ncbi:nucleoside diphosphate kinase regulator [Hymenobacter actinosclerus]|uniref:Regulator of nucleoside diphosphate kinase n=1 Tax=Hymenobacter actinosclerus TaxID=82805 RepID=A0A1I0GFC1_9BACT|nr:nucleoside diphosphate kinase regulator [Hymenobacter actinosclerus]SET69586.1 regulator of nucleoside diphosphate kinase [Hymenobacter actinosclerus]
MKNIPSTSGPIYITKVDYQHLVDLVRQERQVTGNRVVEGLERELKRAEMVDSYDILPDVVTMNSRVRLRNATNNSMLEITLVYPRHADIKANKISILAPVATAVLGCRPGDKVVWPMPKGEATYFVEAVLHQPEASGDIAG